MEVIRKIKANDWSINLEDDYYEQNPLELIPAALDAVKSTASGYYVNLITPGCFGNPLDDFIPKLMSRLSEERIAVREVRYVDECGCGGHVTRVFR
ncbi:hypothetical protein [Gorillibacterium massiliense]|uniref:CGCGG family putative rSAM-modified RiPP protein n=1 Tax=Gorillibacterium massiliense TaxID=1280390 RepID=UPI0004AD5BE3|nr:hypothetical protein [Gorillibacterium massiliense]